MAGAQPTPRADVKSQPSPPRRATSPAMTASPSSARPCATPCRSAGVRFWLAFHLPSIRAMGNLDAHDGAHLRGDEIGRRVRHAPGRTRAFSWLSVRASSCARNHDRPGSPACPTHARQRNSRSARLVRLCLGGVPGRRDIGLRDHEKPPGIRRPRPARPIADRPGHMQAQHAALAFGYSRQGIWLAINPPGPVVRPRPADGRG